MNKKQIYRHGDVDIIQVTELPQGLKEANTLTLAYGEVTGHHHSFTVADKPNLTVYEDEQGNKWIDVREPSALTHQEHKTLTIKKGFYQVKIEREFNPFDEAINKVRD